MKKSYIAILAIAVFVSSCFKETGENGGGIKPPVNGNTDDGIAIGAYPAGDMPEAINLSADGRRLVTWLDSPQGVYDFDEIKRIDLTFSEPDWQTVLEQNFGTGTSLRATMSYDGVKVPDAVGVRYRGSIGSATGKESFRVEADFVNPKQDVGGYSTFILSNANKDESMMRAALFSHFGRKYIPMACVNYVDLYINDSYWGLYVNVQHLNNAWPMEWFLSRNGSRWRAEPDESLGLEDAGAGKSSLNYLGDDSTAYNKYYDLKKCYKDDPWSDLIGACRILNRFSGEQLADTVRHYIDVDRTLWFLALENVFQDKDGYVNKGGTDYYVIWESETGRIVPVEYDGGEALKTSNADGQSSVKGMWRPMFRNDDERYALSNKLLSVPSLRERYYAHYRTVLSETFNPSTIGAAVDAFDAKIGAKVEADPKKNFTYAEYGAELTKIKNFVAQRYGYLSSLPEILASGAGIEDVKWWAGDRLYGAPSSSDSVCVNVEVSGDAAEVNIYLATGVVGNFSRFEMADDGLHQDVNPADGVYGFVIPAKKKGERLRFYIETVASDAAGTRTYSPAGAEHDVYTYEVE